MAVDLVNNFRKAVLKRELFLALSRNMRDIIRKRTKSGKGLTHDEGGAIPKEVSLKALSSSYKQWRRGDRIWFHNKNRKLISLSKKQWSKISAPVLGQFGSPNRSNLTLSGQLLDSMKTNYRLGYASLEIDRSRRRPIKRRDGSTVKNSDRYTNSQILQFQRDQGRFFFNLTLAERRILRNEYQSMLIKELEKAFK